MLSSWTTLVALTLTSLTSATPPYKPKCGPDGVSVRLPPAFTSDGPTTTTRWIAPKTGWIFKPWYQVWTSNAQVGPFLRNFQWDPTPMDPGDLGGAINDLSSFQIPGSDKIYTSYGVAYPHPHWPGVLDYVGTGLLENATSQYSWLAWGCDLDGNSYYVSYSSPAEASGTPAGIDLMSVTDIGPEQATVDKVFDELKKLGNEEITRLASAMIRNIQDGARDGLPRVTTCDAECKTNNDLVDIIG